MQFGIKNLGIYSRNYNKVVSYIDQLYIAAVKLEFNIPPIIIPLRQFIVPPMKNAAMRRVMVCGANRVKIGSQKIYILLYYVSVDM